MHVTSETAISYLMIENPSLPTEISLIDGLSVTRYIEPNTTYRITYENHNQDKANIVLSASSNFLERLSIKFTDLTSK